MNHLQQSFFTARSRALRKTPGCLRGITLVKADGDLSVARLKGAIAPQEFLNNSSAPEFHDVDPKEGFSVRNFQIQAAKSAMTSDIIVYGDDLQASRKLAFNIATAQQKWRDRHEIHGHHIPMYNTFLCPSPFQAFEKKHPTLVAVDSEGHLTGHVIDFVHQERKEMFAMTAPSEISHNVWLGPSFDRESEEEGQFDVLVECSDLGRLNPAALQEIVQGSEDGEQHFLDFPSSGSILPSSWSHAEADGIIETCKWLYYLANGVCPADASMHNNSDGDTLMIGAPSSSFGTMRPRKILIHCGDGYTESTMLAIAYCSFSTGRPVPEAWLNLHTTLGRNFFAYPADVSLLMAMAPRLLAESPLLANKNASDIDALAAEEPNWLPGIDGSFPSRVLGYLYLGNLNHANNPDLLRALGIGQLLSVGETAMWRDGELERWGLENVCVVQGVQDNGIDPLTNEFERCLEFIGELSTFRRPYCCKKGANNPQRTTERGRMNGTATLVHCRVGVSRSATICIAEVMRSMDLSFPRAYCFVRARRLNVIIQPHLRFAYELLKWEENLQCRKAETKGLKLRPGHTGINRELEWAEITREIALMNRPYAR